MTRRVDGEWQVVAVGIVLAGVGWGLHALLLALFGTLGAMAAATIWLWQRHCLTGVTYRRTLRQHRASFGDEVPLDIEIVNDKLLPLTWLHVEDDVPLALTIEGATVVSSRSNFRREMHHLLAMLPFQRVRRQVTVRCDRRGDYTFGPARLRSGDPLGIHQRYLRVPGEERLLVYPKLFRLGSFTSASRVPLGDERALMDLVGDPSRTAGVREYRAGDPLRHIDWRSTARGQTLLVRVLEPTTALRVAVFIDMVGLKFERGRSGADVTEFAIAVGASLVAELCGRGVSTGVVASGMVDGHPVAREPSSSPGALAAMLELLARASSVSTVAFGALLAGEGTRLRRGESAVVVAADFSESTLVALADVRRHVPVTAIWVANDRGRPPPLEFVDAKREVRYFDGWKEQDVVDLLI